jgi:hypothetical protein
VDECSDAALTWKVRRQISYRRQRRALLTDL